MQQRLRDKVMAEGATLVAPETVFLSHDTRIGKDVLIEPNVIIGPGVVIEDGVTIRGFCHFDGAHIGEAEVGPFARLRPGADLGPSTKVGNFVEIKNSEIAEGAKVPHLTYVGDSSVGARANIGAGTITCNYDGVAKHRTEIGAGAFIGSNHRSSPRSRSGRAPMSAPAASSPRTLPRTRLRLPAPRRRSGQAGRPSSRFAQTRARPGNKEL